MGRPRLRWATGRTETDGNYSYTIGTRAAAGFLTVLDEEWKLLGAARGAFTAVPYVDPIVHDPRALVAAWHGAVSAAGSGVVAAVSLLDTSNETITVYPQQLTLDERGNTVWQPAAEGVRVRCRAQPEDADENIAAGQATATTYRVIARTAPLGPWALVEWAGRAWDVIGEPRHFNGSPTTRHIDVLDQRRTALDAGG